MLCPAGFGARSMSSAYAPLQTSHSWFSSLEIVRSARFARRQGVIRYHPAWRKEWREERKKMGVLENDWDDSVPSCLGGEKEGRENGKNIAVL